MDPVTSGAIKNVQQSFVQEAEQSIQKADKGVSDFEKLREKLEQSDSVNNPSQLEAMDKMNQTQHTQQVDPSQQLNQIQQTNQVDGVANVPQIKNMDELQNMVNNIRDGQKRLSDIIADATSGKTYSPSEMIAMQAEVSKITTQLEMSTKVVQSFVEGVKTTLNLQL